MVPLVLLAVALTAGCTDGRPAPPVRPASSSSQASPPSSVSAPSRASSASASSPALTHPVAVVIGNDPGARPQSGLDQADIVWEILAEGWITRYFAIFSRESSAQIGPVRSTRLYFDQLDRAYGLPLAHAGGNVDALDDVAAWHLPNIDQIYGSGAYFWRSTVRTAPDNLYTSTDLLGKATVAYGYGTTGVITPPAGPIMPGAMATALVQLNYLTDRRCIRTSRGGPGKRGPGIGPSTAARMWRPTVRWLWRTAS